MKTVTVNNTELGLYTAQAQGFGHGHKKIVVELEYEGIYELFAATTTDMESYDAATELEGKEKHLALYKIIAHQIERNVDEWVLEVDKLFRG